LAPGTLRQPDQRSAVQVERVELGADVTGSIEDEQEYVNLRPHVRSDTGTR
jgi:hypothetical protein